ncbi:formyltransferase family protein [Flavobacteriaceae bacterium S356]|uniref:Formyltransferase family protein n=1 Tax=Asprobacillus argus TaxID=3076534 RepID=A0ABU3LCV2_9FLAO|nr:formyltransferase family protein [Flavobacteriaceae bacterium S356]
MLKIGVLCSGNLGLEIVEKIERNYDVLCVLTDKNSEGIIAYSKKRKIPHFIGNPRKNKGYAFIKEFAIDVLISVNYLFLIEQDIINHPTRLAFNIHGSLLPKYRGRTPHVWAIINGESKAGITAHIIDSGCDTGNIIEQIEIPIEKEDTGGRMLEKYTQAYFPIITKVLESIQHHQLNTRKQDEKKATYFGKRTPNDGQINWNWKSERIRNWVRAQAYPYPGAFTFYKDQKIIIDKVLLDRRTFSDDLENGQIVETFPKLIVKTMDGGVLIESMRTKSITFDIGNKFDNEN